MQEHGTLVLCISGVNISSRYKIAVHHQFLFPSVPGSHNHAKIRLNKHCTLHLHGNPTDHEMANKFYISLPVPHPAMAKSGSRRPPLTPSTVSPPCLSAHTSSVTRRDSGSGGASPTKATSLLAKVASHPSTPRKDTPMSSPLPSPSPKSPEDRQSPLCAPGEGRHAVFTQDPSRYWSTHRQQDGYISFPDFEKFCQSHEAYEVRDDQRHERTAVKT